MSEYRNLKQNLKDNYLKSKDVNGMRFYLLCLIALESGARVSDLLRLDWNAIDTDALTISYKNVKSKKNQVQVISAELVYYINRYKETLTDLGYFNEAIFYNFKKNSIMSRITANRRTQQEYNINFHNIRKISAQNLASQKGVVIASKFLGHSKVSTTDLYLKVSDAEYLKQMRSVSM